MITMVNIEPLKYNFVFLYAHSDFTKSMLGEELYHHPQVRVHRYAFESGKLLETLYHYHTAYSINEKINLPFKSIWFKRMLNQSFDNDLPICFIYLGGNMVRYDCGFVEYVKKVDPRNKVVMIHWDLISKKIKYDYNLIRNRVDLAITYDEAEARKYNIEYFEENVYSKIIPQGNDEDIQWDVYFLGAAKDRLDKIMAVYHKLNDAGLKCKFLLSNVATEDQVVCDGIEYISGISYEENLEYVNKSKCILELIQGGSTNATRRAYEAIAYQRRLLTDCPSCKSEDYNSDQFQFFDNVEDIDIDFFKMDFNSSYYLPKVDLDPMKRLYFIQEKLEELDERKSESISNYTGL